MFAAMQLALRAAMTLAAFLLPLAAAEPPWAGTYTGDWSSNVLGVKGSFRLALQERPGGQWECQVMFTMGERKVETTVKSLRVEKSAIEVSYEFDLGESRLMSTIHGERVNGRLEGQYRTKSVPDGTPADEGVWKAARGE